VPAESLPQRGDPGWDRSCADGRLPQTNCRTCSRRASGSRKISGSTPVPLEERHHRSLGHARTSVPAGRANGDRDSARRPLPALAISVRVSVLPGHSAPPNCFLSYQSGSNRDQTTEDQSVGALQFLYSQLHSCCCPVAARAQWEVEATLRLTR